MIFREDIPTDKLNMESRQLATDILQDYMSEINTAEAMFKKVSSRQLATDILQDYMSEINTAEAMFKKVSSNCFFLQY